MRWLFPILFSAAAALPASAAEVWDARSRMKAAMPAIESALSKADVIIFGEEHNDKAGHLWKSEALRALAVRFPLTLSLEMLERDQQPSLDEFLRGEISEKAFLNSGKFWPNYAEDYHPLVLFAREKKLAVVAANAPKKYTNLVAASGLEGLYKIRSAYLPPFYLLTIHRQKEYEERVAAHMPAHGPIPMDKAKFIDAQNLWDASMADAIAQAFYAQRRRVLHINGRFHSDANSGVTHRLRAMGLRVLVVSIFAREKGKTPEAPEWQLADFLVLTEKP